MKSKIGINSEFFRPQQYAHKDPRPELPFEKSNENLSLLQFVVIVVALLVLALGCL